MLTRKKQTGFTLIEVVIVIAILGILAAIAIPSYSSFVQKSGRQQAKTLLSSIAQQQGIFYITNRTYGALNNGTAPLVYSAAIIGIDKDGVTGAAGTGLYDVTMTVATASAFTITATAKNAQLSDTDCRVFTLTDTGTQTAVNSVAADTSSKCW